MPFKREIYVLMRILNNVEMFTPEIRRLLIFRSLELYYRTQHVMKRRPNAWELSKNDLHILVCLRLMDKLYMNDVMCNRNLLDRLKELGPNSTFSLSYFSKIEQRVLLGVRGALMPEGALGAAEEDVFLDASRYGAGSMCLSLASEAVTANVQLHFESYEMFRCLFDAVRFFQSRFFLYSTDKIHADLRELHRGVMQYCGMDPIFARIVQCHCRENFGAPCEFLPLTVQQGERSPEADLSVVRFTMMREYTDYVMVELVKFRGGVESFAQLVEPLLAYTKEMDDHLDIVTDVCKRAVKVVHAMDLFATGSCEECKEELLQIWGILRSVRDKLRPRTMRAA